ncbi:Kinesin-like protein kip2, partial [Cryomyces antarcticus]
DSKLTRLLQPALSGSSLISILCTVQLGPAGSIAAASSHVVETLNTLKFASRAKNNIVSHAKKAEEALANGIGDAGSRALLDRYRMEIVDLRKQLDVQTKAKDEEEEKAREIEAEQRHEEQMLEMQLARTALKERIEHLNRLILSSKSLGVNFNRSFSSLSIQRSRASILSTGSLRNPCSARSSTAHDSLEVPPAKINRTLSTGSITTGYLPTVQVSQIVVADASEDEDSQ